MRVWSGGWFAEASWSLYANRRWMMGSAPQEFEHRLARPTSTWPRRVVWLAAIVLPIPLVATLVYAPLPGGRVTTANFRAIRVGMSISELRALLGLPRYESVEMGLVSGPTNYTVNFDASDQELESRGFKEYVRYVWISPQITITSIVDTDGKVVSAYGSGGQPRDLRAFLGSTETQRLPRRADNRPE